MCQLRCGNGGSIAICWRSNDTIWPWGIPRLEPQRRTVEADKYRLDIARGLDPAAERAKAKAAKASITTTSNTFRSLAERYIRTHSASWSKKHHQQWQNSLAKHVYPVIGGFRIAEVDTDDVLDTLTPIWNKIPVTANRIGIASSSCSMQPRH